MQRHTVYSPPSLSLLSHNMEPYRSAALVLLDTNVTRCRQTRDSRWQENASETGKSEHVFQLSREISNSGLPFPHPPYTQ